MNDPYLLFAAALGLEMDQIDDALETHWEHAVIHHDALFVDRNQVLWFPPGAKIRLPGDEGIPEPKHFCALASTACQHTLDKQATQLWIHTLTGYPSYLHFVTQSMDSVRSINSQNAHLIQSLVPMRKAIACPRLNLAFLAKQTAFLRFHILSHAMKPTPWGYDGLAEQLLNSLPRNEREAHYLRQHHVDDHTTLVMIGRCYTKTRLRDQRWTLCGTTGHHHNENNNHFRRFNYPNHALVFDLVCNFLLTDPMFNYHYLCDHFDDKNALPVHSYGYKHDVTKETPFISQYIPWTMIVRYMDPTMFKLATKPWFHHQHIAAWFMLNSFNFWNASSVIYGPNEYYLTDDSQMPHLGTLHFYREIPKNKFIFAADVQAQLSINESRYVKIMAIRDAEGNYEFDRVSQKTITPNGMMCIQTLSDEARTYYHHKFSS